MSNGSSFRPRRFSITLATRGTCGDVSTSLSIPSTRDSSICRPSSKLRRMCVGAVGEYGSMSFTALNVPRSFA
jgi:hypothetical protein